MKLGTANRMKQVIIKQAKERIRVDIELEGVSYQLWRLDDIEYSRLRQHSMPIQDADGWFYRSLFNYGDAKNKFNLAKLFVVLEYKFGKSSNSIDDWKGSFSFPLLLVIEKERETFYYMMNISDHRGCVEFRLYRIVMEGIRDKDNLENSVYKKPFEAEFSREKINYFISYFYGYLEGYFPALKILTKVNPFLKKLALI